MPLVKLSSRALPEETSQLPGAGEEAGDLPRDAPCTKETAALNPPQALSRKLAGRDGLAWAAP